MVSKKKKNILYLALYAEMGGGEYSVFNLLKSLDRRRFSPVVVMNQEGEFQKKLESIGVEVILVQFETVMLRRLINPWVMWKNLKGALAIKGVIVTRPIELVHCSDLLSLFLLLPAYFRTRIPIVYNVIMFYTIGQKMLLALLARLMSVRLVANSAAVKNSLSESASSIRHPITVAYNGVDTTFFHTRPKAERRRIRKQLDLPLDKSIVGLVARYEVCKGHDTYLEAASTLCRQRADLFFLIVGKGTTERSVPRVARYRNRIQERIRELNLGDRLKEFDHTDDIPRFVSALDVLVCSSDAEPYGLVVLEGYASGVPVVASKTVGALEVLKEEKGIFICEPMDAISLSERILAALDSGRQKPRAQKLKELSWKNYARQMEQVYDEVLAEW